MVDKRVVAIAIASVAVGCTFERGDWFANLTPTLTAAYVTRADRDAGAGWQKLSNDYQVRVATARLGVGEIGLIASSGGSGGGGKFDPAKPAGYTLCHNGHCHSTDGRLVPYAEIEAGLGGGGGAGLRAVVALSVEGALDLLAPDERMLPCKPSCNLDRVTVLRATGPVASLVIEGAIRDGRRPARLAAETPFRWELRSSAVDGGASGAPSVIDAELNLPADEDHPPNVALRLEIQIDASLFDAVEFAQLAGSGGVLDLSGPTSQGAHERLRSNLGEAKFMTAAVSRGD